MYNSDTEYSRTNKISVTEALYCLRKAYYFRTIDPVDIELLSLTAPYPAYDFYTFVGKVVHSKIQEYVSRVVAEYMPSCKGVIHEKIVEDDCLIGHIDTIIITKDCDIPIEFKTCRKLPREAYKEHIIQLSTYMTLAKHIYDFEKGYITYISRTEGDIQIFEVSPKKEHYEYVRERALKLINAIKQNEPPEREDDPFCWKCIFSQICMNDKERR